MRRHDRVYLRPGAGFALADPAAAPALRAAVAGWLAAGRPLVAARQPGSGGRVQLGLALPRALGRQRVAVLVEPAAILEVSPPLTATACLGVLAAGDRALLATLAHALAQAGVCLGVFGSLAWEALSGEAYRHADSDIDVIADVADRLQLETALALLADAAGGLSCRLDGELRLPGSGAVAWRELAAAWTDHGRRVLVKGEQGVALHALGTLLAGLEDHALAA